jgi:hypothetical protein
MKIDEIKQKYAIQNDDWWNPKTRSPQEQKRIDEAIAKGQKVREARRDAKSNIEKRNVVLTPEIKKAIDSGLKVGIYANDFLRIAKSVPSFSKNSEIIRLAEGLKRDGDALGKKLIAINNMKTNLSASPSGERTAKYRRA